MIKNYQNAINLIERQGYQSILDQDGWETLELTLNDRHPPLVCSMIITELKIRQLNLYEIYVYNDCDIFDGMWAGKKAGEISGWSFIHVLATPEGIKTFPWFDCVVSENNNSTYDRARAILWR